MPIAPAACYCGEDDYLFILNEHPYQSERCYNALRLATAAAADEDDAVSVFLIGDAVWSAVRGQAVPEGRDDIPWMLDRFSAGHRRIGVCRTCMERRGIAERHTHWWRAAARSTSWRNGPPKPPRCWCSERALTAA